MNDKPKAVKNKYRRRKKTFYKLHRYLGLVVAISLVWLSISGILLNHTQELALSKRHVTNQCVMKLYGVARSKLGNTFKLKKQWLYQANGKIYWSDKILFNTISHETGKEVVKLLGVSTLDDVIVIAITNKLLLITLDGELIDSLAVSEPMLKIGMHTHQVLIQTNAGIVTLNQDLTALITTAMGENDAGINWSIPVDLTVLEKEKIYQNLNGIGPTLEQLILDTHSGRLFGMVGVYLTDLVALLTILLTLIGVYLWASRKLNNRS